MSGYIACSCRDCCDIAITSGDGPVLCADCKEAGCEVNNGECRREDAYGTEEES